MSHEDLKNWLLLPRGTYKSYHRSLEEGLRTIADELNDRRRTMIDSYFFGSYGKDIIFAALTLNN